MVIERAICLTHIEVDPLLLEGLATEGPAEPTPFILDRLALYAVRPRD